MRIQKRGKIVLFSPQKSVLLSSSVVGSIATIRIFCWALKVLLLQYSSAEAPWPHGFQSTTARPLTVEKQETACVVNKDGFGILIELCNIFRKQQIQPKIDCPLWVWVKLPAWLQLAKARPLPQDKKWRRRWELGSSPSLAVAWSIFETTTCYSNNASTRTFLLLIKPGKDLWDKLNVPWECTN